MADFVSGVSGRGVGRQRTWSGERPRAAGSFAYWERNTWLSRGSSVPGSSRRKQTSGVDGCVPA